MKKILLTVFIFTWLQAGTKPRARDLGISFDGISGPLNSITDVDGVEVGHKTLIRGDGKLEVGKGPVRTGITAVLPRGKKYDPVLKKHVIFKETK